MQTKINAYSNICKIIIIKNNLLQCKKQQHDLYKKIFALRKTKCVLFYKTQEFLRRNQLSMKRHFLFEMDLFCVM